MTEAEPSKADFDARAHLDALIAYADDTRQTLLAALLSQAKDALEHRPSDIV